MRLFSLGASEFARPPSLQKCDSPPGGEFLLAFLDARPALEHSLAHGIPILRRAKAIDLLETG